MPSVLNIKLAQPRNEQWNKCNKFKCTLLYKVFI
jgi:hypothetical protein